MLALSEYFRFWVSRLLITTTVSTITIGLCLNPMDAFAEITVIAKEGDPSPINSDEFLGGTIANLSINDAGMVSFFASTGPPVEEGFSGGPDAMFFVNPDMALSYFVSEASISPGGGSFSFTHLSSTPAPINSSGQTAFVDSPVSAGPGVFLTDVSGTTIIALNGDPSFGGASGVFNDFDEHFTAINDSGQVLFVANTGAGEGVFLGDGTNGVTIALEGQNLPGRAGTFDNFADEDIALNNLGQVAFLGTSLDTGSVLADSGLFFHDGDNLTELAVEGSLSHDGVNNFGNFPTIGEANLAINDAGQVLVDADLSPTASDDILLLIDTAGASPTITTLAQQGQVSPVGATFTSFEGATLNEAGQVVFTGRFNTTAGVFVVDSSGEMATVALTGAELDKGGTLGNQFDEDLLINDLGQVAFMVSDLEGVPTTEDAAIFAYSESEGLIEVIREGDSLLGSTVATLVLDDNSLNNNGTLVFEFTLVDGTNGVATFNVVPEPSSVVLLAVGVLLFVRFRRS